MKTKRSLVIITSLLLILTLCFMSGCKKDEPVPVAKVTKTPEQITEETLKAMLIDYNADNFLANVHEAFLKKKATEEKLEFKDVPKSYQEQLDILKDTFKNIEFSWTLDKPTKADNLDDVKTYCKECGLKLEDAQYVNANITIKGTFGEEEQTEETSLKFCIVKVDGQWFLNLKNSDLKM